MWPHCLRGEDTAFALCSHCLRGEDTAFALWPPLPSWLRHRLCLAVLRYVAAVAYGPHTNNQYWVYMEAPINPNDEGPMALWVRSLDSCGVTNPDSMPHIPPEPESSTKVQFPAVPRGEWRRSVRRPFAKAADDPGGPYTFKVANAGTVVSAAPPLALLGVSIGQKRGASAE